jgi:hypothetical protein
MFVFVLRLPGDLEDAAERNVALIRKDPVTYLSWSNVKTMRTPDSR